MFKNNKRLKILIVVIFLQLLTILYISASYEFVALAGNTYKFNIEGYDPVDPLRGRYLAYIIDTETIKSDLGAYTGKCYITIKKGTDGYAYLDKAYKEKPEETDYIIGQKYGDDYYETPFTKYYVNETIALQAEELFRENSGESYVTIKVKNGKSIVEGFYIGDKLIDNYFE